MATTKKEITGETVDTTEEIVEEQKEAVNVLDMLLGSDVGEIKLPTKKIEITRLSEAYGVPFILTCRALTPSKFEEVQDMAVSIKGKDADIEVALLQVLVVMEGVMDPNGKPMFKNKELMLKFKAPSPKDLVKTILLSGEIAKVYETVSSLSGFGEGAVKEVKN